MDSIKLIIVQVLIILILPIASLATADTTQLISSPLVTSSNNYTISDGLATNCLAQGFVDRVGRLWVNPCKENAKDLRMSFFQFDGEQSLFYELRPEWLSEEDMTPVWYILGETSNGFLFGGDLQFNTVFYWNTDSGKQFFYRLEGESELLNMDTGSEGSIIALTVEIETNPGDTTGIYRVIRLKDGNHEEITSIELNVEGDFIPHTPKKFSYPFEIIKEEAFFFHQSKGIVKTNLKKGTIDFFSWQELSADLPILQGYGDYGEGGLEWKMINSHQDGLLLFLGMNNGFFTLDGVSKKLIPHTRLNQLILKDEVGDNILRVHFAEDHKNNLLIVSAYLNPWVFPEPSIHRQAFLIDQNGNFHDYEAIIPEMNNYYRYDLKHEGNYFSSDFRYEVGSSAMSDGLTFWEIQHDLNIKIYHRNPNYHYSYMNSLDSTTLLINSNRQVLRFNVQTGRSERLTKGEFLRARALSSFDFKKSRVWMSADFYQEKRTGLQWYDPATNQTDHIPTDIKFEKFVFLNDTEVVLFKDDGSFDDIGDLFIFNLASRTKRTFLYKDAPFSIGARVNDLFYQGDTLLWVGAQNGLWLIDFQKNEVQHFNQYPELKGQNILTIHQEDDGVLWLGSSTSGVFIFDPGTLNIQHISDEQGLANNTVVGILTDDQMNHWVSTFNGISVLDTANKVLLELTMEDGLMSNKFYQQAHYKLPDGRMIFGLYAGIIIVDPKRILSEATLKKENTIYLTDLEYYDSERNMNVINQGSYRTTKPIQIPAAQRYLHLDFALSDYVNLKKHIFSYRLIPFPEGVQSTASDSWINLGSESQLTLNNLPAGEYIVQVRGIDQSANQVAVPLEIPIVVNEFFYRKWWFYLLCALPFGLGALIWIQRIKTENRRLELEVDRRTTQIQQDKLTIENQAIQLQELDQAKSRFFTNISHEFRTPLTVVLGLAEQIQDQERIQKLIRRNAKLLLGLINQILELRKLESGNVSTQFIQSDIVSYIHYLIESFHSLAVDKEVQLKFETTYEHFVLDYDTDKLLHILTNLLVNAIKFTPTGGEVKVLFEVQENTEIPFYQISVSDTGLGIPAHKLAHIFDRFYQVDDENSRTGSGTGIGLTLVKELVHLLNGEIKVESIPEEGTCFQIKLPISKQAPFEKEQHDINFHWEQLSESLVPSHQASTVLDNDERPRLLIVEDNVDVMDYLVSILENDYQLLLAHDGLEGVEKAVENVPDIIISDVMMPKLNGFELCHQLKTDLRTSHIPIILLTAKADLDSRIEGLEQGADAYLAKPFDHRELQAHLHNLLSLRQQLRNRYASTSNIELSENVSHQKEDEFIIRLRKIILENMTDEDFGVSELCKKILMSRTQLHNKLKSLTGRSTSHFIRLVRIEKATELLRDSELNISQISLELGIDSLSYFSRIFREETGLSPNHYREKYQEEQ